jgi:hypothetical protein
MCTRDARMSEPWARTVSGEGRRLAARPGNGAATPLMQQGSRQYLIDPFTGQGGLTLRLPTPREPRHGSSRWEVIRYALGSNARTARLCVLWVVLTGGPVSGPITYWIVHIR